MKQPKCHIFAFDFHFNEVVAFTEVILSITTSSLDVNATKGKENLIISSHCSYKPSSIVSNANILQVLLQIQSQTLLQMILQMLNSYI
jgi:hypothetical protein